MLLYVNRYKWVVDWIFVIVRAISLYTTFYIVSIHLMLLFIGVIFNSCRWCKRFNTSHVTLYLVRGLCSCSACRVSIHLMLLFIRNVRWNSRKWFGFNTSHVTLYQYKACKLHIRPERFNTSHVTLYLEGEIIEEKPLTFQYISCYSLSISCPICFFRTVVSIHLMLLFIRTPAWPLEVNQRFQYISCYSLSRCRHRCCYIRSVSIHLMLLFIKLGYEDSDIELGFNTSHVTLYL